MSKIKPGAVVSGGAICYFCGVVSALTFLVVPPVAMVFTLLATVVILVAARLVQPPEIGE